MDIMYFFDIIKRAKSYKGNIIVLDGILINCYDASDDNDESGHHHIIQPKKDDEFYKNKIIFDPSKIYTIMSEFFNVNDDVRKTNKIKNKDVDITTSENSKKNKFVLTISYNIESINYSNSIDIEFNYYDDTTIEVRRLIDITNFRVYTLSNSPLSAIKIINNDIFERFSENPRIQYIHIELGDTIVKVPMIKSFLFGLRKFDNMRLEIINTNSKDLYLYTICIENNDIIEKHISYINNF